MARWTTADIRSQQGRSAVITGTGGLGYETALALARAGADVIIAGRNADKGAAAVKTVRQAVPSAIIRFEQVDLANLASIADFGGRLRDQRRGLDLLINNAGVMVPPKRQETRDGFELQFGTNHLGHFALTGHLLPLLRNGRDSRVVTVSSIAARDGVLRFDDLDARRSYHPMGVYSQSKLACLMFAFELQRRSEENEWNVASIAAHPGISRTELLHNGPGRRSPVSLMRSVLWFLFQPAPQGALPTLYAATSPNAVPGAYYGPDRLNETRGFPALSKVPPQATDNKAAAALWQISEEMTKVRFG